MSAFAACEEMVRRRDPDRFFAALFAPSAKRKYLYALYAFNYELAHIAEVVREPMLAEIRLAWWRETMEGARAGKPRNHDVSRAMVEVLAENDLPAALFERMIEARSYDASPDVFADFDALEAYCDATSGTLMRLAALILGGDAEDLAREAGTAYALSGLLRAIPFHAARRKLYLPTDILRIQNSSPDEIFAGQGGGGLEKVKRTIAWRAREHLATARKCAVPRGTLAAFLPAALVPLYLRKPDAALYRRQLVYLRAAFTGRL